MEIVFNNQSIRGFEEYSIPLDQFLIKTDHQKLIIIYTSISIDLYNKLKKLDKCIRIVLYPDDYLILFDGCIVNSEDSYHQACKYISPSRVRIFEKNELYSRQFITFIESLSSIENFSNKGMFNLLHTSVDFSKLRVDGWAYTFDKMKSLHSLDQPVYIDSFIDKTFIFSTKTFENQGILPYRYPWLGIAHHTFDETHVSLCSAWRILKNPLFKKSLRYCKGIICLSEYLASQYREKINVPIYVISHPMIEKISFPFEWKEWNGNIVHIGEWYRNSFKMSLLKHKEIRQKIIIQKNISTFDVLPTYSQFYINNWMRYALEYLREIHYPLGKFKPFTMKKIPKTFPERTIYKTLNRYFSEIIFISYLPENQYWEILSNSCIFLNLIDCSASFLIMQCISHSIPLIVNRHPAVEEYLGKNYPLYYNDVEEIKNFESLNSKIKQAQFYLSSLNKSIFTIDCFLKSLIEISKNIQ
jgi:hypothetical protein